MNLQIKGSMMNHLIPLYYFSSEGFNFLNIKFIIMFNIVIRIWTLEYTSCFTVDTIPV